MTSPNPPALAIVDRSVRYGERTAIRDVTLEVRSGEVLALAGPNGSGKSTLIRSVVATLAGASGDVRVGGRRLLELSPRERARAVAWMPQDEPVGDNVPLADYVEYGRYARTSRWVPPSSADRAAVRSALEEVDLADLVRRGVQELSGGERQRARLARALAQETPVLLLDEPTAHLDVGHQLDLLERVRTHAHGRGRAVVIAMHDLNLAARFADRVAVLAHGRLRADGEPSGVLSPDLLAEVWGVEAELRRDARSGLPYLLPRLPTRTGPREQRPNPQFRVHVVAGGGSGGDLLRAVLDRGWRASAGVLPLFDTDSELAGELGVPAVVELPFAPIAAETLRHLDEVLEGADAVVVAAFPVGPSNVANLEHLAEWVPRRPTVLLDPPPGVRWDFAEGRATRARSRLLATGAERVASVDEAMRWLTARSAGRPTPSTSTG